MADSVLCFTELVHLREKLIRGQSELAITHAACILWSISWAPEDDLPLLHLVKS